MQEVVRAKRPSRLPVVLTREEVRAVLDRLNGPPGLVAGLLYGSGLRLLEALRLRVKDFGFAENQLVVRDGKGMKDRVSVLPGSLSDPLRRHLQYVRLTHRTDIADEYGDVYLPNALGVKYPSAARTWGWQWIFPAPRRSLDPRSGGPATSPPRGLHPEVGAPRAGGGGHRKAGILPHVPALFPNSSSRGRLRHQKGAGAPRPQ
jgi:integrase